MDLPAADQPIPFAAAIGRALSSRLDYLWNEERPSCPWTEQKGRTFETYTL